MSLSWNLEGVGIWEACGLIMYDDMSLRHWRLEFGFMTVDKIDTSICRITTSKMRSLCSVSCRFFWHPFPQDCYGGLATTSAFPP